MAHIIDETDRRILRALQRDATQSLDAVAESIALSRNACWRRIRMMEAEGVIRGRVALLDAEALGLPLLAIVQVRTDQHDDAWRSRFRQALQALPEVTAAFRMTGDLDYLLHVRLKDMRDYDRFYRDLTSRLPLSDISASFVMEELKDGGTMPV